MDFPRLRIIIISCCFVSILFEGCRKKEIKYLYPCSKDMLNIYGQKITYIDTLNIDTVVFDLSAANYFEDDIVKTGLKYSMERYQKLLTSGSVSIEYLLQVEDRVKGSYIFDGLQINVYSTTAAITPMAVVLADQYKNEDCSNVDYGPYVGEGGFTPYNTIEEFVKFTHYDSLFLYDTYYYDVYYKSLSNNYSAYFTKEDGIIAFGSLGGAFYIQQ